jgi:hypothetical protein
MYLMNWDAMLTYSVTMSRQDRRLLLSPPCYNVRCALCRAILKIGQNICGTTFFADTLDNILRSARQFKLPGLRNACCPTCKHNTDTKTSAWAFHYDCLKTFEQSFDINSAGLRNIVQQLDHRQPQVKDYPEVSRSIKSWKQRNVAYWRRFGRNYQQSST